MRGGVGNLESVLNPGATPIAQAYAGHQFGGFSPQLGDGRAVLLGEVIDRHGRRRDIALKGSGRTPFSRTGDGKAAVGPVLREYLIGEAMLALGIPTTRALAAVRSGEVVRRDLPLPGALLTRVAASHVRGGRSSSLPRAARTTRCARWRSRSSPATIPISRPIPIVPRSARPRRIAPGGAGRPVDAGRLHPRGDEHRQRDGLG
jgi:hypothetical protein